MVVYILVEAEMGIRDRGASRGLGDVFKRQGNARMIDGGLTRGCF